MPKLSRHMEQNLAELESVGFRRALSPQTLKGLSRELQKSTSLTFTLPVDEKIETVDVLFDKQTGGIVGWRKTPRTTSDKTLRLEMSVSSAPPGRKSLPAEGPLSTVTLTVDKFDPGVLDTVALQIDKAIKPKEVLQIVGPDLSLAPLKAQAKRAMEGRRVLLLVHGIFSHTAAAFEGLTQGKAIARLHKLFDGNVIAYDHFTVSKTTKDNAEDLAGMLPAGTKLDIVCHSRGAGVVRFLLEHEAISAVLEKKGIRVGSVVFAAGACLGSPLAEEETGDRLFRVLAQAMVLGGISTAPWARALGLIIRAAVSGIQGFPGVMAMDPAGNIVRMLKGTARTAARRYAYIRANFAPGNLIARFGDEVLVDNICFQNLANDVVVPWAGAGECAEYATELTDKQNVVEFGRSDKEQTSVWHVNFFEQKIVQERLLEALKPAW